ncbi:hypothetical protein GpartN1_g3433.t1 [Galdieria partita]|uniref:C2H2-type domain-containing protein n=1 Tax=Galdieria partita TaxID=83374 RepID=A0A9C7PXE5_9RHOD|nr:hypothetical protein GpartN1_g3433.t1 [Galdieria partita]
MIKEYAAYDNRSVPFQVGDRHVLKAIASNPTQFRANVYFFDEETVTIYDGFPKSRFHLLLLPRQYIPDVRFLTPSHVNLLQHMFTIGTEISNFLTQKYLPGQQEQTFMLGFHSVPSMDQLHMHIISTDFISPSLKTRKHWNSFHTDFFLPMSYVLEEVGAGRKLITANSREQYLNMLKQPLFCHRCKKHFQNMKALKRHICECRHLYVGSPKTVSHGTIDKYFIKCASP